MSELTAKIDDLRRRFGAAAQAAPDARSLDAVRVEFLDPIPPGLERDVFFQRLKDEIEGATARLVAAGTKN